MKQSIGALLLGLLLGTVFGISLHAAWMEFTARKRKRWPPSPGTPFVHTHEPRSGEGSKVCKNCGLNETYWSRWPDCDDVQKVKNI